LERRPEQLLANKGKKPTGERKKCSTNFSGAIWLVISPALGIGWSSRGSGEAGIGFGGIARNLDPFLRC